MYHTLFASYHRRSWLLLAFALFAWQSAAAITATELVSINNAGTGTANGHSYRPAVSADERFVVFASIATNLTSLPTGGHDQCYVRDMVDGTTSMVSRNAAGTAGANSNCYRPVISANGRFVAFESDASDFGPTDTNGALDTYARDLATGIIGLVSINAAGTNSANGSSYSSAVSADGRYIAFQSDSTNLSTMDTNAQMDVFVRDLVAGTTAIVSINAAGTASGNGLSQTPVISADGSSVAFESTASNLVSTDTNGNQDVFARDLVAGTTALVSINIAGTDSGNGPASAPAINADGQYVAFQGQATNLVATDTNGLRDVFLRDIVGGTTALVSVNSAGTDSGNNTASAAAINADGRLVVFQSAASNLVSTDTNGAVDVFAWYRNGMPTKLVSANNAGTNSGNGISNIPSVSPNGFFAGFQSVASNLVSTDTNGVSDCFTRWIAPGNTLLASMNSSGTNSGGGTTPDLVVSGVTDDGSIAFDSTAIDLVAGDVNGSDDVFLRTSHEFWDDFEDNSVPDWTFTGNGALSASSGKMHAATTKKLTAFAPFNGFNDSVLTDVTFPTAGAKLTLNGWYVDKKNRVELQILPDKQKLTLKVHSGGHVVAKKTAKHIPLQLNHKHTVSFLFTGFSPTVGFQVLLDGTSVIELSSPLSTFSPTGQLNLELKSSTHANATCDFGGLLIHFTD